MNLEIIKEGSILIAPAVTHNLIRKQLLEHRNAIPNIRITTLSAYLKDGIHTNDTSVYEYYLVLKAMKNNLIYNKKSVESYSFIHEMMDFINEIKRYNISISSLLEENPFQAENKKIIQELYSILTTADEEKQCLQNVLKRNDLSNVYIADDNASFYDEKIYSLLIEHGATRIYKKETLSSKVWYSALNPRQEVESIAQYIIKQNMKAENIHISMLDSIYLPYIHQIFPRYNIPYYVLQEKENGDILQRFLAIVSYYVNPTLHHLEELFLTHAFKHEYANEFIEYIRLHKKDIHEPFHIMNEVQISTDILSSQEIEALQKLEEKAKLVQKDVLPVLDCILDNENVLHLLVAVDEYICKTHHFNTKDDRSQLLAIRSEIKKAKEYLHTKDDLQFLCSILSNLRFTLSSNEKGVCVTSFEHSIFKEIQFVLGCTQNNFPAFCAKSGIFDENYYAMLDYPSLEERYDYHLKRCMNRLSNCQTLICFTCVSSIDGKACETSLEIEEFMGGKPARYKLEEVHKVKDRNYDISEAEAHSLFVKKGNIIQGSISSLEKYMKCPYSYFLKYGLRIKEPLDYTFNLAKCGTLIHYVLEVLINTHGKEYVYVDEKEIEQILDEKINEIALVYPKEKDTLIHLKRRLLLAIMSNLTILKEHEEHSSLSPSECEYKFNFTFPIDETYNIALQGIIDRIDTNSDFLRVIDYKSSAHTLKEDQVFSAQQLQLITYLLIAQNKFNKRPLGAFYYSMALPSIKMEAGKLKKRPLSYINYSESDYFNAFLKDNRIHGWVCGEDNAYIEVMDDDGAHIVGVSNSKSSGITARTIYHFDTLSEYMHEIYKIIGKKLLSGDISCEASDGACLYCPYARICMKANKTYDKEELVKVTSQLYLKGGRKDADME